MVLIFFSLLKPHLAIKTPGNPHTCAGSSYGCCGDGVTSAKGPNREGCPEFNIIGGCAGTRYGCCEDDVTSAEGPNREGCPEFNRVGGCAGTRYGCCDDSLTSATGPNKEGCRKRLIIGGCAGKCYVMCSYVYGIFVFICMWYVMCSFFVNST